MYDNTSPLPMNGNLKKYADEMRKNPTPEENKMWHILLKKIHPKFHRQRIIGNYIVDFYCPKLKLIIEIDGEQHYLEEKQKYEQQRTRYLESLGYKVLRFYNSDINKQIRNTEQTVMTVCRERVKKLGLDVNIVFG